MATFSRPATMLSHETQLVTIAPTDAAVLAIENPKVWWPNTYGEQPLYDLTLRVLTDGTVSARTQTSFGIRHIDRELYERDGAHGFGLYVNGPQQLDCGIGFKVYASAQNIRVNSNRLLGSGVNMDDGEGLPQKLGERAVDDECRRRKKSRIWLWRGLGGSA